MEIFVNTGAVERHQFNKSISKPTALKEMQDLERQERDKCTDTWYRGRLSTTDAKKNADRLKENINKVVPEKLSPAVRDRMWRRAKQLKDQFQAGMLSYAELHPVKGFTDNGAMKWVVDDEKMRTYNSVERNNAWYKKNQVILREFKNLMRHLCPEDPNAGDIEKFRPKR